MSTNSNGVFKNYNTIEEFKAADKTALFNAERDKVLVYFFPPKFCD
jgi:ubiquitin-like modifier-activating enzyme ATG7